MIYRLADKWKMSLSNVYKILDSTGILDNYIMKCYDVLTPAHSFRNGRVSFSSHNLFLVHIY